MTSRRFGPKVGDVIEVRPIRVSATSKLIGHNYSNQGPKRVKIKKKNLDGVLSEDIQDSINTSAPFQLRTVTTTHPAEIVDMKSGSITVEFIPESDLPVDEDSDSFFTSPDRDEPINDEWEGTPQEIDEEAIKKRTEVFSEEDPRGSKNDLL